MARPGENTQLIRAVLLVGFAAAVSAIPIHAQSDTAKPAQGEPGATASGDAQEAKQPVAADAGAEPAAQVRPEETREAQIERQTKELYRLSAEMRAEVAKTYKETLSLTVLKKAEQIEKAAKSLKSLMDADAAEAKDKNH